jgi:pimeloyl-ACP methyl ester carboxylesterase
MLTAETRQRQPPRRSIVKKRTWQLARASRQAEGNRNMEVTVRSADGTAISARHRGRGSPLVLVHGAAATSSAFARAEEALASQHDVWVYDRRGRGRSGDTQPYALDREVDDVLAVLGAAGRDAHLVGHSFGAVCALLAAGRQRGLRTLTLYEPPLWLDRADPRTLTVIARHIGAGDFERGLLLFCSLAGITRREAGVMRGIPDAWGDMCDGARQVPRELLALARAPWPRPSGITTPTLLLSGSLTRAAIYPSPDELRLVIPRVESAVLERQGHLAFAFDPARFAQAVISFITATEMPAAAVSPIRAFPRPASGYARALLRRRAHDGSPCDTDSLADPPAASSASHCDA